jgi:hypothetical protein
VLEPGNDGLDKKDAARSPSGTRNDRRVSLTCADRVKDCLKICILRPCSCHVLTPPTLCANSLPVRTWKLVEDRDSPVLWWWLPRINLGFARRSAQNLPANSGSIHLIQPASSPIIMKRCSFDNTKRDRAVASTLGARPEIKKCIRCSSFPRKSKRRSCSTITRINKNTANKRSAGNDAGCRSTVAPDKWLRNLHQAAWLNGYLLLCP